MLNIEKPKNINKQVFRNGNTSDIINVVLSIFNQNWEQCRLLSEDLEGRNRTETCRNIFNFIDENVSYKVDTPGEQNVKTPARLLNDKFGDCKSYTILTASILRCLKVPFFFRFVAYAPGDVTHVYIVAQSENKEPIYIDVVAKKQRKKPFNTEINYLSKIDIEMNTGTKISYLSGVGELTEGNIPSIDFGTNQSLKLNEIQLYCLKNLLIHKVNRIKDIQLKESVLNQIAIYDTCISLIQTFGKDKDNLELAGYYLANEIQKGSFEKKFTVVYPSVIAPAPELSDLPKRSEYYSNLISLITNGIQQIISSGDSQSRQYVINAGFMESTKQFIDFWQMEVLGKNSYISKAGEPSNFPYNNKSNISLIADLLQDSALYFAYTQIPTPMTASKEFKRKKTEQEKLLQWILSSNTGLSKECIINIITAGIINKTGVLPGQELINKFKQPVPKINAITTEDTALNSSTSSTGTFFEGLTKSLQSLTGLVTSVGTVFNPTTPPPTATQLAGYQPSSSDWSSTGTMNILIGAGLLVGVIYFIKKKKSKKDKK